MSSWIKNIIDRIKDLNGSVDSYRKDSIIQSIPTVAYVNKAKKLIDSKRYDEAEVVLREALDISTQDSRVYKYLGKIYEYNYKFTDAIEFYENSSRLNPQDKEIWLRLGMSQLNAKMYDESLKSFEKANKVTPMNTDVHTGWGMVLMQLKKYALARDKFIIATQISKYNYTAILLSAIMEIRLYDYDSAEAKLSFLAKVAPNESSTYEYANLKLLKSDFRNAEKFAQKSLEYNKLMLPAYFVLGEVYSIQNELEKTEENFRLAIERGLENEILHFEWGKAYVRFFDFEKAKEQFMAALELDGEFQSAKIGMALVNAHSGDFSLLQELKEKNGENVYIQESIALERFADGKYEDAIDMFKKALRTDSKQKYNYLNIARAYNAWNNKDKTREFYEKFIQECPTYFNGIMEYSKWLINISDFADAQRKLRKADKLRKNDLEVMNLLFYTSYRLVKENVCEYNIKEAISIAEKTKSIGNFDYETEKVELENLLVNIQGNN